MRQHGHLGMGQHLLRFRAEQQAGQAAPAVRGHEDEVAAAGRRRVDDGFVGHVAGGRGAGAWHAGSGGCILRCGEDVLRLLVRHRGELFRRGRVDQGAFAVERHGIVRLGIEEGDLRTDFPGEIHSLFYRVGGQFGAVRGYENMLEHAVLQFD